MFPHEFTTKMCVFHYLLEKFHLIALRPYREMYRYDFIIQRNTVSIPQKSNKPHLIYFHLFFLSFYSFESGTIKASFSRKELSASFSIRATSASHVGTS